MRPPVSSEGERGGGVRVGEGRVGWAGEGERSKSREGGGEGKRVAHKRGGGGAAVSEEEQTEWQNRDNRKTSSAGSTESGSIVRGEREVERVQ